MPELKSGRQYRELTSAPEIRTAPEPNSDEKKVCGYAAKYAPYVLYELEDGTQISEAFERDAFKDTDMSDVIFQYNHQGRVFARQSNGTLAIDMDDEGLHFEADLSRTELARQLYEDIKAGMITKMSWGFLPGEYHYEPNSRTIVHTKVKKIFDISAVSIPANENTEINARSFSDGVIEETTRREEERRKKRERLALILKIEAEKK